MTLPIHQYFNSLQRRVGGDQVISANQRERILVNREFIEACLEDKEKRELFDSWGFYLRDPGLKFFFLNYVEKAPGMTYYYYPDIQFGNLLNCVYLIDIGLEEKSVEEVKERVKNWIFDIVIPTHVCLIFSS
jgi:hypothetical protein